MSDYKSGHFDSTLRIESGLVMQVLHRDRSIEVSVYERNETDKRALLPYEDLAVEWERVEECCREVTGWLNRANRRAGSTAEILSGLKKSGRVLFELLIPPRAREKLNTALTRNLILYVDEKLVQIPWELLFNGAAFLCRRFAMGRIVSTRQAPPFLSTRTLRAPFQMLVLADPCGDLRGAYREGIQIRNFLDERKDIFHVDFQSYPVGTGFIKKNMRDYDIVHYAGHADFITDSPSESGWLLHDGRLKASEVLAMGGGQPMPSLVFCNACQTARSGAWTIEEGYERQIFGLANCYLLAGVRHYIGTFWEILDEPGSCSAEGFYNALARGESIGEALRRMRENLIHVYGEEVLVWGSYVLYGDPTWLPPVGMETAAGFSVDEIAVPRPKPVVAEMASNVTRRRRSRGSAYSYMVSGGLLLAMIWVGYSLFYLTAAPEREIPAAPVAPVPLPTPKKKAVAQVPSPPPRNEVKELPIERITETKIRKEKLPAMEQAGKTPPTVLTPEATTAPSVPDPIMSAFKIAEPPKYKIGDSWTLRLSGGQTVTRRIRSIDKELYVLECDSNRWQYFDRDLVLRKEVTSGGRGLYPPLLNQRLLHFPLSIGNSWEFKIMTGKRPLADGAKSFPSYWRNFRYQVTGSETIETPAGTFGAFKIEERSRETVCDSFCEDVPNTSVIRYLWYAPETRFIVKVAHVSGEPWEGEDPDYELISLDLK